MKRTEKKIVIQNKLGLHARPAAQLVQLTNKFSSEIVFKRGETEVNAKSIMGVLMLAAPEGSAIMVTAEGEDSEVAVSEIEELVGSKFGED